MKLKISGVINFEAEITGPKDWERFEEAIELFRGHSGSTIQPITIDTWVILEDV